MEIILFSLITTLCYGVHDFIMSKPSKVLSTSTLLFSVLSVNITILTVLVFSTQTGLVFGFEGFYILLASIFGYAGFYFYSQAVKYGETGISSGIANAYPMVTLAVGFFFLNEVFGKQEIFFFFCIILGLIFSTFHIEEIKNRKLSKSKIGIVFAFAAMISWAGYVTFYDLSVNDFPAILASWYLDLIALCILSPFFFLKRKTIHTELTNIDTKILTYIIILSISLVIGMVSLGHAFSLGDLALVSAIAACSPAVTTILARIFGKEKLEYIQYLAIVLLVFGIAGLSYVSL